MVITAGQPSLVFMSCDQVSFSFWYLTTETENSPQQEGRSWWSNVNNLPNCVLGLSNCTRFEQFAHTIYHLLTQVMNCTDFHINFFPHIIIIWFQLFRVKTGCFSLSYMKVHKISLCLLDKISPHLQEFIIGNLSRKYLVHDSLMQTVSCNHTVHIFHYITDKKN